MERNEKAARAAGPRARRAGKKPKFWTTVYVGPRGTRKRVLLKSPDGRVFEGTREEVRRAGLLPSERHSLAEGLYINHLALRDKPDTLREQSAFRRMDAIEHHAYRVKNGDAALEVMVGAAARFLGEKVADFKRSAILAAIEAAMDQAHSKRGSFELPLTRQERAALAGLGKSQVDFSLSLKVEGLVKV